MAFTEGTRGGWLASDLLAWADHHLIGPGRLLVPDGKLRIVHEHEMGDVIIDGLPMTPARPPVDRKSLRSWTASQVPHLLAVSRLRVIEELRKTIASGEPGFVHAALYSGRVVRDRGQDNRPFWRVQLNETIPLSDAVLALFAADALENPADYEQELAVCDTCGSVSFGSAISSRRGCLAHPFGAVESGVPSSKHGARPGMMRP